MVRYALPVLVALLLLASAPAVSTTTADEKGKRDKIVLLTKPVRLQFQVLPPEKEGEKPVAITTAGTVYRVDVEAEGEGGELMFRAHGKVHQFNLKEVDKYAVSFETLLAIEGEDGGFRMRAEGSTVLTIGETVDIAEVGDKRLVLTLTRPTRKAGKKEKDM